ncbi:MAG: sucrase ferredoxin [Cyanobacteriota bacterium]|nr:sucrase ferredoxin [Cyanobacteriota bacterium]
MNSDNSYLKNPMNDSLTSDGADCHQFCSVVSKNNGEDPIGTAGNYDCWLIVELPQPWAEEFWLETPVLQPLLPVLQKLILQGGLKFRPLAIARDCQYSNPDLTRVLYYTRRDRLLAQFDRQEYILPFEQMGSLAIALLTNSSKIAEFEQYRQNNAILRDLLVCTHGNVDLACARFGNPIYQQLRQQSATEGKFRVWRCSHFGGHRFAPTLIDLPSGRYWGHIEPESLPLILARQGDVTALRRFYRGWAGLSPLAQIVDREIWLQVGWDWFDDLKSGEVLDREATKQERYATWGEVKIDFSCPRTGQSGSYTARVERTHQVSTLGDSGETQLARLNQYRVVNLNLET